MTAPVTYRGDATLKDRFLDEIAKHEAADQFIKGSYGEFAGKTFRGCAIGCSLHSMNVINGEVDLAKATGDHTRYEKELGLPIWLAYLEDNIFERLPLDQAKMWPRRFAEAIPVGAVVDDRVLARILCWVLTDTAFGVRFATDRDDVRGWIDDIATFIDCDSQGTATADQREAAARAARAAWASRAARAAWAAWASRDAWAAWASRDAWDARAAWASRDAWAARAAWDARDAWDARAARDAWDARDAARNSAVKQADAFFPALSEFVLALLRDLSPARAGTQSSEI